MMHISGRSSVEDHLSARLGLPRSRRAGSLPGWRGLSAVAALWLVALPALAAGPDAGVFVGPQAPPEPRLRDDLPPAGGPLRVLTVEERVGAARRGELVRVPLFFHEGECPDPDALEILDASAAAGRSPIPYQADDVRKSPGGGVARMHLYFETDLRPWERKQFHLVRGRNPGSRQPPVPAVVAGERVALGADDLKLTFWREGPRRGAIAAIETPLGQVDLPHELLAPRLTLVRQAKDCSEVRRAHVTYLKPEEMEVRDFRFGAGPLLAKLVVRIGPRGLPDNAEYTYLVPRRGSYFVQLQTLFPSDPEGGDVVGAADNHLLGGRIGLGGSSDAMSLVEVPAGLRRLTCRVQGHQNVALVNAEAGISLFPIPWVQTGVKGIAGGGPDGYVSILGTDNFQRTPTANSGALRAFWGEVRYVFSKAVTEEDLWEVSRAAFQPLVAVVDEPGVSADDLHQRLAVLMEQFSSTHTHARDWRQEAGRLFTMDKTEELDKLLARGGRPAGSSADALIAAAREAKEKLLADRPGPIKEHEKGRASGPLDPWHLTYAATPIVPLAARVAPSEALDRVCLAYATAQRRVNGRVDEFGFPYVDCFHSALNMQIGSMLFGIHAGRKSGDAELARFYRDAARTPAVLDIYGHGQRTYPSLAKGPGNSDFLYQCTSDFFLRNIELTCDEDLWLHPAVFGRYFDCIDVNADLRHRSLEPAGDRPPGSRRANFFRGQTHDHRWEAWAAGPFLGLLGRADDRGAVGLTEACYYAEYLRGRWINWPEMTTFFVADFAVRESLPRYRPPSAPPLPREVTVARRDGRNVVAWKPLESRDVSGYRIYRAPRMGGPWTLLNSPYREPARPLVREPRYEDGGGEPEAVYFVTAVDEQGRESRWFPDEPPPRPGR